MGVFAEDLKIAGTIDAVFINDDNSLSLYDWKRSKEIKYTSYDNEMGFKPFDKLPNCNFSKYSIQLNIYKEILKTYYNFKIKEMYLIICHPNNDNI